ncbi:MAG TPA: transglutaminase-like domain-containing protein [Daejeonella sp.]|uniref:transglutaminase-like domain-containing protein n=1 Tax=Daejeonella sp. TaxID=2805397 RepID=UPI002EDA0BCC
MSPKPIFRIVLISIACLAGIMDGFSADFENPYKNGSFKDSLKSKAENWTAADLWAQSVSQNLKLEDNAIVLEDNLLIENDAVTLGSIRSEAWDTLSKGRIIRKVLELSVLPARNAWISMLIYPMLPAEPMSGGKLEFRVNGNKPIVYELRHFWTSVPVPVSYLKKGRNLIELRVHNQNEKFRIPMALSSIIRNIIGQPTSFTGNSERSMDNGKTWKYAGSSSNIAEYPIRLKLQAYAKKAWLQTPVINLADKALEGVMYFPVKLEAAEIRPRVLNAESSKWQTRIRSGNTHLPEAGGWTAWQNFEGSALPAGNNHRFIQLEYSIDPGSGNSTPKITGLELKSSWRSNSTGAGIFIAEVKNYPLIRSSFDFIHENPALPELQEFRAQFKLDQVVEGAKTEWEKIKLLRAWTAANWDWFLPNSEFEDLLSWDASKILSGPAAPGNLSKKGGNCLHYAIVFTQACQSFGIPARIVNTNYAIWGGHELVEVWSRDYQKWIMADPNFDTMFYDKKTGIPLNILELHDLFLKTYYPGGEIIDRDKWSFADRDRRASRINPNDLPIAMEAGGKAFSGKINKDYVWWKVTFNEANPGYSGGYGFYNTAEVRWLPRSNWLSQRSPLPVTHGRTHWGWDGYYAWTDSQTPETPEHRYYVRRPSDVYGNLFQVDFAVHYIQNGEIQLDLATDSPGFDHFNIVLNGLESLLKVGESKVKLSSGINIIEIYAIDVMGNSGTKSRIKINYIPAAG